MISYDRGVFDALLIFSKSGGQIKLIFENVVDNIDHLMEDIKILSYPEWMNFESEGYFEFFFVLEDTIYENVRRYGFCTQWMNKFNNCLEVYCLISQNNWRKEFNGLNVILHSQRIIENIKTIANNDLRNLNQFVERFCRTKFPESGKEGLFFFRGSNPHLEVKLPFTKPYFNNSMFRDCNLLTLCKNCDSNHLLTLFASVLKERTLVFVGRDHRMVFDSVCAIQSLLEPFKWQYSQIPLLPKRYETKAYKMERVILGVHSSANISELEKRDDVAIWDIDRKEIRGGIDVNNLFPRRVLENMYVKLQKILPKPGSSEFDSESVHELFMKFVVDIFVTYRNYLTKRGSTYTFNRVGFLKDNPQNNKNFLMEFFDCKAFKVFIDERIRMKRDGVFKMCRFEEKCSRIIPTLYGISLYGKSNQAQKIAKQAAASKSERKGSAVGKLIGLGRTGLFKGKGWFGAKTKGGGGKSSSSSSSSSGGSSSVMHPSHLQQIPDHRTIIPSTSTTSSRGNFTSTPYSSSSSSSSFSSSPPTSSSPFGSGMSGGGGNSLGMAPRKYANQRQLFSALKVESPHSEYSKKLRRLDRSFSVLHEESTPEQILEGTLLNLPKEEIMFPSEISSRTQLFNEVIQRQEKRIAQLLDLNFDESYDQEEERLEEEKESEELKGLYIQLQKLNKEL